MGIRKSGIVWLGTCLIFMVSATAIATPEDDGIKGIQEYEIGNIIDGMELLYKAADNGYAPAQSKLGYILDQSEEDEKAIHWFTKAADQGDADGQYGLGSMFAKGDGVEKDFSEAIHWIRKAAKQGHLLAIRTYATALENGELGISSNEKETLRWLNKGAEGGDSLSIQRLARAHREGDLGLNVDLSEAARLQAMIE